MKQIATKAFTLVELLIVIGIIGILAVTLLLNLNPAEIQKKARDSARIKDLVTLQAAVEQCLGDNLCANMHEDSTDGNTGTRCDSNWTGINLCTYLKTVPIDPRNAQSITYVHSDGSNVANTGRYRLHIISGNYKISTLLESVSNRSKVGNDGGTQAVNSPAYYEVFSDPAVGV